MKIEPEILIFRTNILKITPDCETSKVFNANREVLQWSVDTEDIDCVLRVVTPSLKPENIIATINKLGYECSELQ